MPVNLRPLHDRVLVKRLESDEEQLRGGIKLENVQWNDLGDARKVVITKDDTTAVTDSDDKARVEDAMHATEVLVSEIKDKEGGNGGGGMGEGMGGLF